MKLHLHIIFPFVFAVGFGCKKPPPEPSEYTYTIKVEFPQQTAETLLSSREYHLRVNGQRLAWKGESPTRSSDTIVLPKETLLGDPKTVLEIVRPTGSAKGRNRPPPINRSLSTMPDRAGAL